MKLYVMTHKPFTPPPDPLYQPLHVGMAHAKDLGFPGDDTGDSISEYNASFCELTGMYWIWKNDTDSDYLGICHYRRYLIDDAGKLFSETKLRQLLSDCDIITTKLLTLPVPYEEGFAANHHSKDLLLTGEIIDRLYPDYSDTFRQLIHGKQTYFGNIFVTSKELYDRYCSWLFPILFAVREQTDMTGYNGYQMRLYGFLAEFLQTVWIQKNHLKTVECMVGMSGEKYETHLLKEQLAACFLQKDFQKAQHLFEESYRKRPDILMEASDVTGELRICMQIISTCSFEQEQYGHCILDELCDYRQLISHFHQLNSMIRHLSQSPVPELLPQERTFLQSPPAVSPESVRIALQLFCKDAGKQQELLQLLSM